MALNQNTKNISLGIAILIILGLSFYAGRKSSPIQYQEGYEYIQSDYIDSLENVSNKRAVILDSVNMELENQRMLIDGTDFLTDSEVEEIVKQSYDELHNQSPSRIDSLFINEYDSAVSARRLYYNRQR